MKTFLRRFFVVALPTILLVPASVTTAHAAILSCGDLVSRNTILDQDVGPCGVGLTMTADNITLDLNGYEVFGNPAIGDGAGITMLGRTGVTVKNGTVREFDVGVVIEGGSANTVQGINAVNNISFETIQRRGGDGIAILSSQNNRILRNNTVNNGPYSGIGIYSDIDSAHPRTTGGASTGNVIDGNTVANNIQGRQPNAVVNTDNIGIRLEPGNARNFILNNDVYGNGLDGITLFTRSTFNVIRGNNVTRNGFYRTAARRGNGIGLQIGNAAGGANDNLIENNNSTNNADNGISIRAGSLRNTVRNNNAVNNAVLPPASTNFGPTFDLLDNNPACDFNLWRDNNYVTAFPPDCAGDRP